MSVADSPLRDRVIFVQGAPRSGTTWLVTLLATHPEIAGVEAESHLFDFGVDRVFDNLEHRNPDFHGLASYLDRDALVDLVRDFCDGVLVAMRSQVAGGTRARMVVEKTPIGARWDGLDLERKRDCYPDAHYVHLVREREAVIRSLMRAPFMTDRSRDACASVWDRAVGGIREHLGELPRYREVRYEDLAADPAEVCRGLFSWLALDAGEDALERVRVLSRERYSELGAVRTPRRESTVSALRGVPGRIARRAFRWRQPIPAGEGVGFEFVKAIRARDEAAIKRLTLPSVELVLRSPNGDRLLRAEAARAAIARIASDAFTRRHVGEWCASAGAGPGEWWTSTPEKQFCSVFISALGGDATRVDVAFGLELDDGGRIKRMTAITAGALSGRPVIGA